MDVAKGLVPLRPFAERDLQTLSEAELASAMEVSARLVRLAAVPQAMLAAEVSRRSEDEPGGGMARRHGHRNATRMVAKGQGGTPGQARDAIVTGGLFGGEGGGDGSGADGGVRWPAIAAAVTAGDLSQAQARLLIETLEGLIDEGCSDAADQWRRLRELEQKLVAKALALSLADLRKVCLDVTARWNQVDWEAKERQRRAQRFLNLSERADGMVSVTGLLDPASAAPIITWLDAQVADKFRKKRDAGEGPAEPGEAGRIRVDALVDLARHGMRCDQPGSGVSTTVVVRVSEEALRRGLGFGTCDALATPFSGGELRRLAVDAGILPIVLGGGSAPLDVGYALRFFTAAQRHALAERDGGCAFCHAPVSWCDAHHLAWWKLDSGPTDLANGVLLCTRCHHRIHDDGWEVKATRTRVWFIPPASVDPTRTPREGGKAALHVDLPGRADPPR